MLDVLLGRDPRDLAGAVVAVLGSGGKTSLLSWLARELALEHPRVLISTSTKVYPFPGVVSVSAPGELAGAFARERVVFLGRRIGAEGKLSSLPGPSLAELLRSADVVLLECDGARGRPFKVHLPHDPHVPPEAALALVVVGAAAVGRPVSDETVHRCGWAPPYWPLRRGEPLSADAMTRILLAPDGYLGKAGAVPVRFVLNQADRFPDEAASLARALARRWAGPIVVGAAERGKFVPHENPGPPCTLVLLAAGKGERARGDKRRLTLRGRPLLAWTLAAYRGVRALQKLLVLGPEDRELAQLGIRHGFAPVTCADAGSGMSASLRAGLAAASRDAEYLLVALGDMPAVRAETLDALLAEAQRRPGRALRPVHRGQPGHPVLLPRACFDELATLRGDRGARELLPALDPFPLECDDPGVILDLDHPEQAPELESLLDEEFDPDVV